MSFLNKYIKNINHTYYNSKKIGNAIYSVGFDRDNNTGIVSKTDIQGTIIWEKKYSNTSTVCYAFVDIILCTNGDLLILADNQSNSTALIRINNNGDFIWEKRFQQGISNENWYQNPKLIHLGNENYVLLLNFVSQVNSEVNNHIIYKIGATGSILAQRVINSTDGDFSFAGLTTYSNKIAIYGGFNSTNNEFIKSKGVLLELNFDLKEINLFDSGIYIQNVRFINQEYFVSGSLDSKYPVFIKGISNNSSSKIILFELQPFQIKANKNFLYIERYSRDESVITKIDNNFTSVWTKKFIYPVPQPAWGTIKQVTDSDLVLLNTNWNEENASLGLLDLDLNSCKTVPETTIETSSKGFSLEISKINYTLTNNDYSSTNNVLTSQAITSTIEKICTSFEAPCIKDEKICDYFNNLNNLQTSCLREPGSIITDYKSFIKCFQSGLEIVQTFITNYSELVIINLENYIQSIHIFIKNPSKENYLNAYSSFEFIMNYISQLGNCNCENTLTISQNASIQSGNLYLQAAGSTGEDSTAGIHLRWAFREALSEHLPKGNYATNNYNFNKPNDFVKIFRIKYTPYIVTLDFNNAPLQINEIGSNRNWIYKVEEKIFHVHFRNISKYNQVRSTINPNTNTLNFIEAYSDSLIEIETKNELSFKITPNFISTNNSNLIKTELLSVVENKITAPRAASLRKKYNVEEINQTEFVAENIRVIRFISSNSFVASLSFEFYSDAILNKNSAYQWEFLDKYALTKGETLALQRLEPQQGVLDNWLRYNDQAYVNVQNYKKRWNSLDLPYEERIITSVEKYIDLSDALDNPKAIEIVPFNDQQSVESCNLSNPNYDPNNPDYDPYIPEEAELNEMTGIVVSYLETLLLGSLDYHVARMLGLGTLDIDSIVFEDQFIYMAEYYSSGDLKDGLGSRTVQHLYCSLPTSLYDYRLPIAVDLKVPKPGFYTNNGYNNSEVDPEEEDLVVDNEQNNFESVELTVDGYSPDGKTRYYSLYAESIFEEDYNAPFYYVENEFIASESTYPIFAGLEYRKSDTIEWIKPELSHNTKFFNIDNSGISENLKNETVELVIPDQGEALYTHAVKESGFLDYSSYGINWFSRASMSEVVHYEIETIIRPTNELLPPTNVNATLIQKESPLFLTTTNEQLLLDNISDNDKTLVRLTFEYNHAQELIDYHQKINDEIIPTYNELHNSKELFADKIQVFFRDEVPNNVTGKIKLVNSLSDPLLVEVHTEPYAIYSSGVNDSTIPQTLPPTYNESFTPILQSGTESNYIGSILLVNGISFLIHQIDNSGTYPKFIVFKSDASGSLLNLTSASNPSTEVITPEVGELFTVVENMQNEISWNIPSVESFEVNIDLTNVHREDELIVTNLDCSTETHVQKFRGIYHEALIEKIFEKVDENQDGSFDIIIDSDNDPTNDQYVEKHLGLYKVTFNGYQLAQHSQYNTTGNSVEWYNGVARIHSLLSNGARKNFKVVKTEHIGTTNNLILYLQDPTFPTDDTELQNYKGKLIEDNETSITQKINYYPSYKVYLYRNDLMNLNKNTVLPQGEEEIRYTIFGLRSKDLANEFVYDNTEDYFSKMSVPAIIFANAILEPLQPEKPSGGFYATRPDYFGKSSYTFTTKYGSLTNIHKPYAVQFNRASDIQFLSAIYNNDVLGYDQQTQLPILNTVQNVMQNIFLNGEENFYVDRWNNLLNFDYNYTGVLPNDPAFPDENGYFRYFEGKRLPIPNNPKFIESINLFIYEHNKFYNLIGTSQEVSTLITNFNLHTVVIPASSQNAELRVKDFLKDVLLNCFVPLTEIPVIYNYINGGNYKPIAKKQVVRDRNGNMLKPTDEAFDMAPMMKRIDPNGQQYETQFTDFGLDGASNAKYFYAVREINNQLKTSDYSKILGPISLVNTAPPIAPEIIKVIPVLENRTLGITPSIQLQINAYPKAQNIAKVSIYRTDNPSDALSIRTMKLAKILDLEAENLLDESKWIFEDDFSDLIDVIPFGDPLFYRLTVSRIIRYNDKDSVNVVDYAPSEASKLIITNIVENYSPESPVLNYTADLYNPTIDDNLQYITLSWEQTVYKGNYHLYKMNSQGNWVQIIKVVSDRTVNGVFSIYNIGPQGNWVNTIHPDPITLFNDIIYLPLELTNLAINSLVTKTTDGNPIYHHFKVIAENTAGMFSSKENILTMFNANSYNSNHGIAPNLGSEGMIIQGDFIVKQN